MVAVRKLFRGRGMAVKEVMVLRGVSVLGVGRGNEVIYRLTGGKVCTTGV